MADAKIALTPPQIRMIRLCADGADDDFQITVETTNLSGPNPDGPPTVVVYYDGEYGANGGDGKVFIDSAGNTVSFDY